MLRWARRLPVAAAIAGPLVFVAAAAMSAARQHDYPIAREHLSGLAARDAQDRHLMVAGFLALGTGTLGLAAALDRALGGRASAGAGPAVVGLAGVATIGAGLFPRDRMLLYPAAPALDVAPPTWANQAHDLLSAVAYGAIVAAPLLLARRFRGDPDWSDLVRPAVATSAATAVLLALFASKALEANNGVIQRLLVAVPLVWCVLLAARLLRRDLQRV